MKLNKGFYRKCSLCEALCERQLISDNSIAQAFTCSVLGAFRRRVGRRYLTPSSAGAISGGDVTQPLCGGSQGPSLSRGSTPRAHIEPLGSGAEKDAGSLGVGSFRVGITMLAAEAGQPRGPQPVAAARSRTGSGPGVMARREDAGTLWAGRKWSLGDSLRCSLDWLSRLSDQLARSEAQRMRGTRLPLNFLR